MEIARWTKGATHVSCSWTRSSACLLKDLVSHPLDCAQDVAYLSVSFWYFLTLRHCASSSSVAREPICLSWLDESTLL